MSKNLTYRGDITNGVLELNLVDELPSNSTTPTVVWFDKTGTLEMDHHLGDIELNWKLGDPDIRKISLGTSCKHIGVSAFEGCATLTGEVSLPPNLESIGTAAFKNTNIIGKISYPDRVKESGYEAFRFCSFITEIDLNKLEWIQYNAFEGTSITSIKIPDTVKTIGTASFRNCGFLTDVMIGKNVNLVWGNSFKECSMLKNISFPDGMRFGGSGTFQDCVELETVICRSPVSQWTTPTTPANNFLGTPSTLTLYVYEADLAGYDSAWQTDQGFTGTIKSIESSFKEFTTITDINNISNANVHRPTSFESVLIGDPGNAADATGRGAVNYEFRMSKYAISEGDIAAYNADPLNTNLQIVTTSYGANKPAQDITFREAARYVNWLNYKEGYAPAYKFNPNSPGSYTPTDANTNPMDIELYIDLFDTDPEVENYFFDLGGTENKYRHKYSKYFLPTEDEWYKAAYYDPDRNGPGSGGYWEYSTASDTLPTAVASGTSLNTLVYDQATEADVADVDQAGGLSAYGTMGQCGNTSEWTESSNDGSTDVPDANRVYRGGGAKTTAANAAGTFSTTGEWRVNSLATDGSNGNIRGFRVASRLGIADGEPETGSISYNFDLNKYAETISDFNEYNKQNPTSPISLVDENDRLYYDSFYKFDTPTQPFFGDKAFYYVKNTGLIIDTNNDLRPGMGLSWNDSAKYINWLNEREGYSPAYNFNNDGENIEWDSADAWQIGGENLFRHKHTKYFIPSENEWFKSAFFSPNKFGADQPGYYAFATGYDEVPFGLSPNVKNGAYYNENNVINSYVDLRKLVRVNEAGTANHYGLIGQDGQCYEYLEDDTTSLNSPIKIEKVWPYPISAYNFSESTSYLDAYGKFRTDITTSYSGQSNLYKTAVVDPTFNLGSEISKRNLHKNIDASNETFLYDNIGLRVASVTNPIPGGGTVLYRVNCGSSSAVSSTSFDDLGEWTADGSGTPSPYLTSGATNKVYALLSNNPRKFNQNTSSSIPTYFPIEILDDERYEDTTTPLIYTFPINDTGSPSDNQLYEVRLYFSEIYHNNDSGGDRKIDVKINGITKLSNYDIAFEAGGVDKGIVETFIVGYAGETPPADLTIELIKSSPAVDNPKINGIEIIKLP